MEGAYASLEVMASEAVRQAAREYDKSLERVKTRVNEAGLKNPAWGLYLPVDWRRIEEAVELLSASRTTFLNEARKELGYNAVE